MSQDPIDAVTVRGHGLKTGYSCSSSHGELHKVHPIFVHHEEGYTFLVMVGIYEGEFDPPFADYQPEVLSLYRLRVSAAYSPTAEWEYVGAGDIADEVYREVETSAIDTWLQLEPDVF